METTFDLVSRKLQIPHPDRRRALPNAETLVQSVSSPRRRGSERHNAQHEAIVEAGGGQYVPGMMGPLVLFNSKKTGSTLALPENLLTAEEVARKLLLSDKSFGK